MDESSENSFLGEFENFGDIIRIGFVSWEGSSGRYRPFGDRLTGVVIVGWDCPRYVGTGIMRSPLSG